MRLPTRQLHRQGFTFALAYGVTCMMLSSAGAQKLKPPDIKAKAAFALDAQTGAVLFAKNADKPLPPASTTKILTGLLLAQHPQQTALAPISPQAAQTPGDSAGLKAGETVPVHSLLDALLIVSANDAAEAAAEYLDGSVPAFVQRMNAEAPNLSAPNSRFRNPHGLHDPNHLSTARDLAQLARTALQNPTFAAVVRKPSFSLPRSGNPARTFASTNTLLGTVQGMEGVKTGWTPQAGQCFVGAATRNGRRIITVVLNSPNWQNETKALLEFAFRQPQNAASDSGDSGMDNVSALPTSGTIKPNQPETKRPIHETHKGMALAEGGEAHTRNPSASGNKRFWQTTDSQPRFPWWLWLLLLLVLALFALWAGRKYMASLWQSWAFLRRKNREHQEAGTPSPIYKRAASGQKIGAGFVYSPPRLPRRSSANWLHHVMDNPNRLLEPAVRRHAAHVLSAQQKPELEKLIELLASSQAKLRFAAAELLLPFLPRRAEETLTALVQDDKIPPETRADAVQTLSRSGADRHEMLWLQMLLKDNSLPAANALAHLPTLDDKTEQALRRVLTTTQSAKMGSEQELRLQTLSAASACVLASHDKIEPERADNFLQVLPAAQREQTLVGVTKNAANEWTVKNWLDQTLHGNGYALLPSLMDADPNLVRDYLQAVPEDDAVVSTRALTLRWFLLREGDAETVKRAANAGDTLALGCLTLEHLHRWNPHNVAPDVLLAGLQIVSARLGYTAHSSEQISAAFRVATDAQAVGNAPELTPLADAYSHPAVRDAVQVLLQTDDGLTATLAALAPNAEPETMAKECAFWMDKAPASARLHLAQTLQTNDSSAIQDAVSLLRSDGDPQIRAMAQRLHASSSEEAISVESPPESAPEPVALTMDQAA